MLNPRTLPFHTTVPSRLFAGQVCTVNHWAREITEIWSILRVLNIQHCPRPGPQEAKAVTRPYRRRYNYVQFHRRVFGGCMMNHVDG